MHVGEAQEIETQVEAVANGLTLVGRDAVPLVDAITSARPCSATRPMQARVLLGDGVVRVEHADHHVGAVDRLQRLDDGELLDRLADPGAAAHAGGVDQHVGLPVALERHFDGVARRAGLVERDQALLAEQAVDQRGFAHVGPSDHRDANGAGRVAEHVGRIERAFEPVERALDQRIETLLVRGRNRDGFTEAEAMELRLRHVVVQALGLVRDDDDGLAAAPQEIGDVQVLRRAAFA